jgi:hypothetical protein
VTYEIEKLQRQVDGLTQVLLSLAHNLERVEPECDLRTTLQGVGNDLKQLLVALNDGPGSTGDIAAPIPNYGTTERPT